MPVRSVNGQCIIPTPSAAPAAEGRNACRYGGLQKRSRSSEPGVLCGAGSPSAPPVGRDRVGREHGRSCLRYRGSYGSWRSSSSAADVRCGHRSSLGPAAPAFQVPGCPWRCPMAATTPATSLVPVQPVFTDAERHYLHPGWQQSRLPCLQRQPFSPANHYARVHAGIPPLEEADARPLTHSH